MVAQIIVVTVIVAAAVLYLARQTWRTWTGKRGGCSKGCGCGESRPKERPELIAPEQLLVRMHIREAPRGRGT